MNGVLVVSVELNLKTETSWHVINLEAKRKSVQQYIRTQTKLWCTPVPLTIPSLKQSRYVSQLNNFSEITNGLPLNLFRRRPPRNNFQSL